ncbi:MAG: sigma-54-dependent transcriptional regulator [Syntrophobacteraceae bacterium]
MKDAILIVDDEEDLVQLLKRMLESELDCEAHTALSGVEALAILEKNPIDVALIDMRMPGMNGLELLERLREEYPWLTVIMMTAYGCIELAVNAIKTGAYDFISKPFEDEVVTLSIAKALERRRLVRENMRLQRDLQRHGAFEDLIGKSPKMYWIYETIAMVAKTDITVLITGESGTGKDLTARAIHSLSDRRDKPFVAVNCPTVPENILESELFGYKKGAFTHASQNKIGLFQEAHRGSIFLDEIGDISTTIQTKLLRVLQEKEIKPLGDTKSIRVDVRVIASTNRNLPEKIKRGEFREDLYYRLNVLPITLPPLRERREDIPLLVNHFLEKHCAELKRPMKSASPELMEVLLGRPWEGNVRELENIIIRGILFSPDASILPEHIGFQEPSSRKRCLVEDVVRDLPYKEAKEAAMRAFHDAYLKSLFEATRGNVSRAAKLCGMERQALQQVARRYGMDPADFRPAKSGRNE